jgi:hypothetical protein
MNRIRAVIVALVAFATITTSCTPHDLAEWQQVTGIDLSPEHEQQILDCSTAKAEADALAPEHDYLDLDTPMRVYELIARGCRRWTEQDIANWAPGVRAVMNRESAGCYNLRRGASFADHTGAGCAIGRQGPYTDSGYGQVLMGVHRKWLCAQEGLCTPEDVIATPSSSMTAFLALIERAGRQGWCYSAKLRRGAICQSMANIPIPKRGT